MKTDGVKVSSICNSYWKDESRPCYQWLRMTHKRQAGIVCPRWKYTARPVSVLAERSNLNQVKLQDLSTVVGTGGVMWGNVRNAECGKCTGQMTWFLQKRWLQGTHTHMHTCTHPCGEINKLKETEETYEVIVILEPYYHLNLNNSYLWFSWENVTVPKDWMIGRNDYYYFFRFDNRIWLCYLKESSTYRVIDGSI